MSKLYFMTKSVESISNVIPDKALADAIEISFKIRCESLDRACAIPGYKTLTYKEKARVYDAVRAKVMMKYGMEA